MMIHFIRPWMFFALLPALALVLMLWRSHSKRTEWGGVCDPHLLPFLQIGLENKRTKWPVAIFALALFLAIFALAGPSWRRLPQEVFSQDAPIVFLLDLSAEMNAADIKPSRLQRAKYKIIDFLKQRQGGQAALVVFSGEPFVVSPLTDDKETIGNLLQVLEPNLMPVSGHNLASAMQLGAKLIARNGMNHGDLVVFSNRVGDAKVIAAAKKLAAEHIRTYVVAVGTKQGAPMTDAEGQLVEDSRGSVRISQLDLSGLRQLAKAGDGKLFTLSADDRDVRALLSATTNSSHWEKGAKHSAVLWQDEGHWFIFAMLPLVLVAFRRGYL